MPGGDGVLLTRGVGRKACGRYELRREQAGHAFLATADADLFLIVRYAPADREAEFGESLVERDQVAKALGVGQHSVAVKHECLGRRAGHALTRPCRCCRSGACGQRPYL